MEYMNKREVKFIEDILNLIKGKEKVFYNFQMAVLFLVFGQKMPSVKFSRG